MLVTHLSSFSLDRREALTLYNLSFSCRSLPLYLVYVFSLCLPHPAQYELIICVFYGACVPRRLPLFLHLSPALLHMYYQYVVFLQMMGGVRVRD